MPPCTRRHALHGAAALLAGLAGCSGSNSGSATPTATERPVPEDAETDPDHVLLRNTANAAAVRHPDAETPADDEGSIRLSRRFVTGREAADGLTFGDGVDDEGVAAARRLLADTDFDSETVYLEQRRVRECYTLDLCHVRWEADRIETQYGRRLRPADVACERDADDVVATLVRIPAALDPDEVRRYSSGTSGSACRDPEAER